MGLLFDHGADCINTGLSFMTYCQIMGVKGLFIYNTLILLVLIFWVITLEEYYFGSLDFPIINAVNEGTLSMCLSLIPGLIYGNHIYSIPIVYGLCFYEIMYYTLSVFGVLCIVAPTLLKCAEKKDMKTLKTDCRLIAVTTLVLGAVANLSTNSYLVTKQRLFQYLITFILSKVTISIMICHITGCPLYQNQKYVQYTLVALIGILLMDISGLADDLTVYGLYFSVTLAFTIYFSMYCAGIIKNMSSYLNIKVFELNPVPKKDN